jgi:hypothetical protein
LIALWNFVENFHVIAICALSKSKKDEGTDTRKSIKGQHKGIGEM